MSNGKMGQLQLEVDFSNSSKTKVDFSSWQLQLKAKNSRQVECGTIVRGKQSRHSKRGAADGGASRQ